MLPILAPVLATLAQNGFGLLVNAITEKGKEVIEDKLGIKIPDDATKLTPELLQQLKIKEMEHEEFLIEASIKKQETDMKQEAMYLQDTQNARSMQMEALKQDDVYSKRYVYHLATFSLLITALYIFWITFGTIPDDNVRFADTILGFLLGTVVSTIMNFFYGTSKGSSDKNTTIDRLLDERKNK